MGLWVYACMHVCIYGVMNLWICGFMDYVFFIDLLIYEFMDSGAYGFMHLCIYGFGGS